MSLLNTAFSVEKIWESDKQSRKTIRFKYDVQRYELNKLKEISKFRLKYKTKTFRFTTKKAFRIYERGHERYVQPLAYRDRVIVHSFCQNILLENLKKYLIYDNCASIKGRGVDKQLKRLEVFLHKYFNKYHTNEGYVLHVDFTKYFDNILHEKAVDLISEKINDEEVIDFLKMMLKLNEIDASFLTNDEFENYQNFIFDSLKYQHIKLHKQSNKMMAKSVGLGNELSQIIGVFYPYKIDNYIKIVKGFKFYGRYMDDLIILHNNKEDLMYLLDDISAIAYEYGIFINKHKTYIQKLSKPIPFLKTYFVLTDTGKVIKWKHKGTFVRERRKLKKLYNKMQNGKILFEDIENQYRSWRGTVTRKGYNNYHQVKSVDELYNLLFKEEKQCHTQ